MKYIKGIIFDLDGVICHTDKYHYLSWKKVADELDIEFDENINNRLRGVSRMESLEIILEKSSKNYNDYEKNQIAEKKNSIYRQYLMTMTNDDISKDVRDTLCLLKEKGYCLAIGSSSKNAKLILEKTLLLDMFDAISDGTNITHSKPNPEVFLEAAKMLNLSPNDCIVVEDAVSGIIAGNNAGMCTVAIGDASNSKMAAYDIEKLSDIISIIEKE